MTIFHQLGPTDRYQDSHNQHREPPDHPLARLLGCVACFVRLNQPLLHHVSMQWHLALAWSGDPCFIFTP